MSQNLSSAADVINDTYIGKRYQNLDAVPILFIEQLNVALRVFG